MVRRKKGLKINIDKKSLKAFWVDFKIKIFIQEALIFLLIQVLGVWAGLQLLKIPGTVYTTHQQISVLEFILIFLIATFLMIGTFKVYKGDLFFKIMFFLMVFLGSQIIFDIIFPSMFLLIFVFSLIIAFIRFLWSKILSQNIAIILGVAGISASLGLNFSPAAMLIILVILSVYDFIAVYKTQHMVSMFKELVQKGVFLSIVVPDKLIDWFMDLKKVNPGSKILFLGTGDLALPLVFAVSSLVYGIRTSIGVIIGSLVGLSVMHIIFNLQKKKRPMPALPPIALGAILGFLISFIG